MRYGPKKIANEDHGGSSQEMGILSGSENLEDLMHCRRGVANHSLGCAAQPSEAGDMGPWEPHAKTEDPAVSLVRLYTWPSPTPASDVHFRLASGFEAGPVNH